MYKVFLSYSTYDLDWANDLRNLLASPGLEVFISEYDLPPGKSLSSGITEKIKSADLFVLIWSRNSSRSIYVQKEVFFAKGEGISILPVVIQSGIPLPPELGDIKYLDITEDPESQADWLQAHVKASAKSKAQGNIVALALLAFLGYVLYKGGE